MARRLLALSLLAAGCAAPEGAGSAACEIAVNGSVLTYVPGEGQFELRRDSGEIVLADVHAEVVLEDLDGPVLRTDDGRDDSARTEQGTDTLGAYQRIVVTLGGDPTLEWHLSGYEEGFFTFMIDVVNESDADIAVARVVPLDAGALYLGADPARHRVLEDGSWGLLDHFVEVVPGNVERDEGWAVVSPGAHEGSSVSNWNHAVVDLDSGATWIAGALSFEASTPVMALAASGVGELDAGRAPFTTLRADTAYLPAPQRLAPGDRLESELFYAHPGEPDPFTGVEHYAEAVAQALGITPWTERGERVPNGWNSWTGSASTGGYGQQIDEAIVLANLAVMARELRGFGMDWFQVDDGWQVKSGDWTWDTTRFPSGPEGVVAAIRDAGFRPGLWISPFTLDPASATAVAHPEWLASKTTVGTLVTGDTAILDLTNAEALAHVAGLGAAVRGWGFEWLKSDFGYHAMFGDDFDDPSQSREQAYRAGMKALRSGLGDDAFLLGVSLMGLQWGLVDDDRLTLDNTPAWDWPPGVDADEPENQQGFKPTMRTVARRYWIHGRLWVNHPDLIMFRSNTADESWPRIRFDEARSFASFVGLSGGIVKLGDKLVDLQPAEIDVVRRLLPIDGRGARPVDLFEREFPERWHLILDGGQDGLDERWHVVGLFNLGWNLDLGTEPYTEIPDDNRERTLELDLAAVGLEGEYLAWEFWTQTYLGRVSETLAVEVPSHDARVVSLRERTGQPQFLGWNRQITMGGTLLESSTWDEASSTLALRAEVVPGTEFVPFEWHVAVYLPEGYRIGGVTTGGAEVTGLDAVQSGEVVDIRFNAVEAGTLDLIVQVGGSP